MTDRYENIRKVPSRAELFDVIRLEFRREARS